jgi:hypothetical protein
MPLFRAGQARLARRVLQTGHVSLTNCFGVAMGRALLHRNIATSLNPVTHRGFHRSRMIGICGVSMSI